ncbi:glycosyltransferase family 2 protein [Limosilactobacillus reuteri]|uniref:glycosyltransferase family 2 protein n=1 Tax=Limosilactobacillus reuteri TaxID=1598 RepID=UPI002361D054|nr:glycosyltransferase family 2 protein [Limosilactobacillus reuteri]MDD1401143.1 glycosyltransferase family 2 protein [Limosilactobacillus reuteri]
MVQKQISVVVPIYNVKNYLNKCIDSLLKQDIEENFEIILVDDGSTDGSDVIVDKYAENHSDKIVAIHKKNSGLSDARNVGIDKAKGQWIAFVDSDDYVSERYLSELYSNAKLTHADLIACSYYNVDENNNVVSVKTHKSEVMNKKKFWQDIYINNVESSIYTVAWNKLYAKKIFNNLRYRSGIKNEDDDIIYSIIHVTDKISFISSKLYYYRKRKGSIMDQLSSSRTINTNLLDIYHRRTLLFIHDGALEFANKNLEKNARMLTNDYLDDPHNKSLRKFDDLIKNDYMKLKACGQSPSIKTLCFLRYRNIVILAKRLKAKWIN